MTLLELAALLREYVSRDLPLDAVRARLLPVLAADPLDVEHSDASRWEESPADERLFWRLVYLVDGEIEDEGRLREIARRVLDCLARTGSSDATHELLPILQDAPRLADIVAKHARGIISRTGFLSVVAESGYPDHVKLWLRHAPIEALCRLRERLEAGAYDAVIAAFESRP